MVRGKCSYRNSSEYCKTNLDHGIIDSESFSSISLLQVLWHGICLKMKITSGQHQTKKINCLNYVADQLDKGNATELNLFIWANRI